MKFYRACILLLVLALVSLAGCCGGRGSTVETKNITTTKSLGDELIDLKKAYESGAITESQYEELKQKKIEQHSAQ